MKTIAKWLAALLITLTAWISAHGATVLGTTTDPTGIDGLEVNGVTYDVTLINGGLGTTQFTFAEASQIGSAIDALFTSAGVTELLNSAAGNYVINIYHTPNSNDSWVYVDYSSNIGCSNCFPPYWSTLVAGAEINNSPGTGRIAEGADFTVASSPVPLPASVWLMLSALGGLGELGRTRRPCALLMQ